MNHILGMVNRAKPTNEQRQATHSASAEDYDKLAKAVMNAIVLKHRDVLLCFPYFVELDSSFPKGVLYAKDEKCNYYRAKAFKIADWLHERGHLPDDAKGIVKSMRTVSNLVGEINRMILNPEEEFLRNSKNVLDSEKLPEYNAKLDVKDEK